MALFEWQEAEGSKWCPEGQIWSWRDQRCIPKTDPDSYGVGTYVTETPRVIGSYTKCPEGMIWDGEKCVDINTYGAGTFGGGVSDWVETGRNNILFDKTTRSC